MMFRINDIDYGQRKVPWNGLGTDISKAGSIDEALNIAGLNWDVLQRQAAQITGTGEAVPVEGQYVNVRDDNGMPLGIVGARYSIVQNIEAFSFMDSLIGEGVRFEKAGMFKGGRAVWILARLPERYIMLGNEISPYIVFINSHDGTGGVRAAVTPIRVICSNMLSLSMKRALRTWSVRHSGDMMGKLDTARDVLFKSAGYMDALKTETMELNGIELNSDEIKAIVDELIPITADMGERKQDNRQDQRDDILQRFYEAPDLLDMKDTGLKLLHAVSDHETHYEPLRKTGSFRENLFISGIKGMGLTDKARELILSA